MTATEVATIDGILDTTQHCIDRVAGSSSRTRPDSLQDRISTLAQLRLANRQTLEQIDDAYRQATGRTLLHEQEPWVGGHNLNLDVSEVYEDVQQSGECSACGRLDDLTAIDDLLISHTMRVEHSMQRVSYSQQVRRHDERFGGSQSDQAEVDIGDSWTPGITVPRPFRMTLRERTMSASHSHKCAAPQPEPQQQHGKAFKSHAPPAHIYLPLYEQLCQQQQQRRLFIKQHAKQIFEQNVRSFTFATSSSSTSASHMKRCHSSENISRTAFRATPVPARSSAAGDWPQQETAEQRRQRLRQRAEDKLQHVHMPGNMQQRLEQQAERRAAADQRRQQQQQPNLFRPSPSLPDFAALHNRLHNQLQASKLNNKSTTVKPFNLNQTRAAHKCEPDYGQAAFQPLRRTNSLSYLKDNVEVKWTTSALTRQHNARQRLAESNDSSWSRRELTSDVQMLQHKMTLTQRIHNRQRHMRTQQKQAMLRQSAEQRSRTYAAELAAIEQRVAGQPTLVQRQQAQEHRHRLLAKFDRLLDKASLPPQSPVVNGGHRSQMTTGKSREADFEDNQDQATKSIDELLGINGDVTFEHISETSEKSAASSTKMSAERSYDDQTATMVGINGQGSSSKRSTPPKRTSSGSSAGSRRSGSGNANGNRNGSAHAKISNGNGNVNGNISNGNTNGSGNGTGNGHRNGISNGISNGHANGNGTRNGNGNGNGSGDRRNSTNGLDRKNSASSMNKDIKKGAGDLSHASNGHANGVSLSNGIGSQNGSHGSATRSIHSGGSSRQNSSAKQSSSSSKTSSKISSQKSSSDGGGSTSSSNSGALDSAASSAYSEDFT